MQSKFSFPNVIHFGAGSIKKLPSVLKDGGVSCVQIVTDKLQVIKSAMFLVNFSDSLREFLVNVDAIARNGKHKSINVVRQFNPLVQRSF